MTAGVEREGTDRGERTLTEQVEHRWEPQESVPDGWRRGAQWLQDDGSMSVLYTNAPSNASPYDEQFEHRFITFKSVPWRRRFVSEWEDVR